MRSVLLLASSALLTLLLACGGTLPDAGEAEGPDFDSAGAALTFDNSALLNGRTLNGRTLNGDELSGLIVSTSFSGVRVPALGSQPLSNVRLEGTRFAGELGGTTYRGASFNGGTFYARLGNGAVIRIRIDAMSAGSDANADLTLYDISYAPLWSGDDDDDDGDDDGGDDDDDDGPTWRPACRDAQGVPVKAVPVAGRWNYRSGAPGGGAFIADPGAFTFACVSGAIGKCVLQGYRPWETFNGAPLAPRHQACVRAVRADYCGDGRSWTQPGRTINIYDDLGREVDTEAWRMEAAWTPAGAACFRGYNRAGTMAVPCYRPELEQTCDAATQLSSGAFLITEIP